MKISNPEKIIKILLKAKIKGKFPSKNTKLLFVFPKIKTAFYENEEAKAVFNTPFEMIKWWVSRPEITFADALHSIIPHIMLRDQRIQESFEVKLNDPKTLIGHGLIEETPGVSTYAYAMGNFGLEPALQRSTSGAAMILKGLEPADLTCWNLGKNWAKRKEIEKAIKLLEASPGHLEEIAVALLPDLLLNAQHELEELYNQTERTSRHRRKMRKAENELISASALKALQLAQAL